MKKMFLLFSHNLTQEQVNDAKSSLSVEKFIKLDEKLQQLWSNIPADLEDLEDYLKPLKDYLSQNINRDDIVLVQGDFGATCAIALFINTFGATAVYATTKRDVIEKNIDGKIVKTSVFKHVRFRRF